MYRLKYCSLFIVEIFLFQIAIGQHRVVYKDSSVINFFRRTSGWVAGDGAFSVPLSDGRMLWLMGDSYIDHYDLVTHTTPCLFQVNNAGILQDRGDWNWQKAKTLISNRDGNKSFFRDTSNSGVYYWPISGIQLGDTVYVYYSGVRTTKGGFESTGRDVLAKILFPEMKVVGFHRLQDFNKIGFGRGFILSENKKHVYVYGEKFDPANKTFEIYAARFAVSKPDKPWQFWNGKSWNKNAGNARAIGTSAGMTPMVSEVKSKFVLLSTEPSIGCDMGSRIYTATSDSPLGPFTNSRVIFAIDDTLQGHYPFFYVPVAHPSLINDREELLVTYNINGYGTCIPDCVNNRRNPDYYRPRGIRVPLELIDDKL